MTDKSKKDFNKTKTPYELISSWWGNIGKPELNNATNIAKNNNTIIPAFTSGSFNTGLSNSTPQQNGTYGGYMNFPSSMGTGNNGSGFTPPVPQSNMNPDLGTGQIMDFGSGIGGAQPLGNSDVGGFGGWNGLERPAVGANSDIAGFGNWGGEVKPGDNPIAATPEVDKLGMNNWEKWGAATKGVGDLMGAWAAWEGMDMARKQFGLQSDVAKANVNNTASTIEANAEQLARARAARAGGNRDTAGQAAKDKLALRRL